MSFDDLFDEFENPEPDEAVADDEPVGPMPVPPPEKVAARIMDWFEKELDISISVDDAMEIVRRQYGEGDAYEEGYRDVVFGQIIKKIIEDETFQ